MPEHRAASIPEALLSIENPTDLQAELSKTPDSGHQDCLRRR
jgi:hypothetical protein